MCVCVYNYMCRYTHALPSVSPSSTWNFSFPNSQGACYFIFYVSFCLCALLPFVPFVISFQRVGACRPPAQI